MLEIDNICLLMLRVQNKTQIKYKIQIQNTKKTKIQNSVRRSYFHSHTALSSSPVGPSPSPSSYPENL